MINRVFYFSPIGPRKSELDPSQTDGKQPKKKKNEGFPKRLNSVAPTMDLN